MRFKFSSIKSKLLFVSVLILIIPSLVVGLMGYKSANEGLDAAGKATIQNAVTMAMQTIDALNKEVEAGKMSLEDAQEQVKIYLLGEMKPDGTRPINRDVNLGKHGYFVVYDEDGKEIAHPTLEGQNVWEVQDKDGQYLVQEQIKAAQNGGGFTTYSWNFPNEPDRIGKKIMYNKLDVNWDWVVTAGSYMEDFNKSSNEILWTVLITLTSSLIVGLIVVYVFADNISKSVVLVKNQLHQLSENNLTVEDLRLNRNDEIGQLADSMNLMKNNLIHVIENITDVSSTLTAYSGELAASAEETNRVTDQIVDSIHSISDSSEIQSIMAKETEETVQNMAKRLYDIQNNMEQVRKAADQSFEKVQRGKEELGNSSKKMGEIQIKTSQASSSIHQLGKKSNEIGNIVELIADISAQTNLLALNAAIEAARAGEHGKGFAVVASEVRKLAEESNRSAAQINQLVLDIQGDIKRSVQMMDEGEQTVQEGIESLHFTGEEFEQIEQSTLEIVKEAKQVLSSVRHVYEGADQMVKAAVKTAKMVNKSAESTETVAKASREQSATIQEVAAASASLSDMADELSKLVVKFQLK
ncbi:methyl-accepting chemotaxis protein [Sporosarcina sp. FA9]|uniref:methyl-accepting chemotaxis protein n=1 Tax=Sporosarcina sp. FA9 TaxID=3413030 RepID=UPI003F656B96